MQSPWLVFLDEIGARFEEGPARIVHFGDERAEVASAASGTVLVPLTHTGLIRAEGEDTAVFLHNLLSNDVKKLPLHGAQFTSFNSAKGRMLANLTLWRDNSSYLLQLSTDLLATTHKKLSMFVMRSKVRLSDATDDFALIGVAGADAAAALDAAGLTLPPEVLTVSQGTVQAVRIDADRIVLIVPVAQAANVWQKLSLRGAKPAGTAAWRWLDIQAGVPQITAATQDEFVAQMLNFELLGGVNFQKGCYPGQEIVARTQYLGKLKKRMYLAHLDVVDAPLPGSDLFAPEFGEQSCGKLLSVAPAPQSGFDALAVLQIASFEGGQVHLGTPDGPLLTFGTLPYVVN
ncbi:MAG: folate-binding protein YgfZ [Rhodocyclales bacterium]|nr:folate-binding protein YgfZ [Rhodocyclales bacterium]